jgi:hypothetical protein
MQESDDSINILQTFAGVIRVYMCYDDRCTERKVYVVIHDGSQTNKWYLDQARVSGIDIHPVNFYGKFETVFPELALVETVPSMPPGISDAIKSYEFLMNSHPNLISITPVFDDNTWVICFTVFAKGFIPFGSQLLPRMLDRFACRVIEGVGYLCTGTLPVIQPGAGNS